MVFVYSEDAVSHLVPKYLELHRTHHDTKHWASTSSFSCFKFVHKFDLHNLEPDGSGTYKLL